MKKRFLTAIPAIAAAVLMAAVLWISPASVRSAAAAGPIPVDMYLIGGQSNAAGYSNNVSGAQTFQNVMYAGRTNERWADGTADSNFIGDDMSAFRMSVTTGLGNNSARMGPEYGIAKAIHDRYDASHKALIFKSAAGGTALRNSQDAADRGNWYPPSLRTEESTTDQTGAQYDFFVENFRTVFTVLTANGYAPRVAGMVWMQGETDRDYPALYRDTLLPALISDIRSDLSEITGEDLSAMPFVMGEISETFSSLDTRPTNQAFIRAQREAAAKAELVNVVTADTSDMPTIAENGSIIGTDAAHWSAADMVTLGERFGAALLGGDFVFARGSAGGAVTHSVYKPGVSSLTFTVTPEEGYAVKSFTVNGVERKAALSGNTYTVSSPKGIYDAYCEFSSGAVSVTYDYNKAYIELGEASPAVAFLGERLRVYATPKRETYAVDTVRIGETALEYDEAAGCYVSQPLTGDVTVTITHKRVEAEPLPETKKGCSGSAAGTFAGGTALAVAATLVMRRRVGR